MASPEQRELIIARARERSLGTSRGRRVYAVSSSKGDLSTKESGEIVSADFGRRGDKILAIFLNGRKISDNRIEGSTPTKSVRVTRKTIAQDILPILKKYRYEDPHIRAVIADIEAGEAPLSSDAKTARRALMNIRESGGSSFAFDTRRYTQSERDELLDAAIALEKIVGSRPIRKR